MPTYKEDKLPIANLLLDANNYRFQETENFVYADAARLHETTVQQRAYRTLRDTASLQQLKSSILRNGFIPIERLVVTPYAQKEGCYVVIEGNRRLAAMQWIQEDDAAGVNIPASVKADLAAVPVIVVQDDTTGIFRRALMGVRHVSGIDRWGGYQRAKLVVELKDDFHLDSGEIAERLGMTAQEVNRRYRAFKALQQMQQDEEFGPYAKPETYPLFHEAVSLPTVREWLGWDEEAHQFTKSTEREQFYSLVTPTEDDERSKKRDPKITTFGQVRELRNILADTEAKAVLLDANRSFLDAMTIANRDELSRTWLSSVAGAIDALRRIGVIELQTSTAEERGEIAKLRDLATTVLQNYEKLKQ